MSYCFSYLNIFLKFIKSRVFRIVKPKDSKENFGNIFIFKQNSFKLQFTAKFYTRTFSSRTSFYDFKSPEYSKPYFFWNFLSLYY